MVVKIKNIETTSSERNPNLLNVRLQFTIDVDQQVAQLDLNLRAADEATIGQEDGETFVDELVAENEYDTLDPFYSL